MFKMTKTYSRFEYILITYFHISLDKCIFIGIGVKLFIISEMSIILLLC